MFRYILVQGMDVQVHNCSGDECSGIYLYWSLMFWCKMDWGMDVQAYTCSVLIYNHGGINVQVYTCTGDECSECLLS